MSYLIFSDFKKLIQTDNLNDIIGNDMQILTDVSRAAVTEAVSYLAQKYDRTQEFADMLLWDPTLVYKPGNRIYLDATAYDSTATYQINALTLNAGSVYIATAGTGSGPFNPDVWTLLGKQFSKFYGKYPAPIFNYLSAYALQDSVYWANRKYTLIRNWAYNGPNSFPDKAPLYWGNGVDTPIDAGVPPTDTTKWVYGDNRNQQLLNCVIDIALYTVHSRISPRNIPDLRVKRYDDSIDWLKGAAQGTFITADLPKLQEAQGQRIRTGGQPKQNNTY